MYKDELEEQIRILKEEQRRASKLGDILTLSGQILHLAKKLEDIAPEEKQCEETRCGIFIDGQKIDEIKMKK